MGIGRSRRDTDVSEERGSVERAPTTMKYSPQLDGLRAIAILAVLVFHTWPMSLRGGFTGVDVFFVLSGYLITSVILHDVRAGKFTLREFYLRRIQRLLPNAVLTVLVTSLLAVVALLPSAAVKVAQHGLWTVLNLSNFYIRTNVGGYWGDAASTIPLLHTWSLAVEEQFYIFFPWTLWWLVRRPRAGVAMGVLAAGSFALSVYSTWTHPMFAFYMLPPRAWELLLGSLLAMRRVPVDASLPLRPSGHSRFREALGWAGVALMLAGFVVTREDQGFPGYVALLPTLGALAVIVVTSDGQGALARALGQPFMVTTGRLSYSLYLWHWPLIVIGREFADLTGRSPQLGAIIGAAASVLVSAAAYRFVELPLRNRGPGRGRRLAIIAACFATATVACLVLQRRDVHGGMQALFDRASFRGQPYNASASEARRQSGAASRVADIDFAPAGPLVDRIWNTGGVVHAWGPGAPRVVVFGSSHALMYAALIDSLCRQRGLPVAFLAADGASVFSSTMLRQGSGSFPEPGMVQEFVAARRRWVHDWRPAAVFVIDRWDQYQADPSELERGLRELVTEFGASAGRLVVLSQVPVVRLGQKVNLREVAYWYHRNTGMLPRLLPDVRQGFRDSSVTLIERTARELPKLQLVRLESSFLLPDGAVRYASGREFYYADDDHLTDAGAALTRSAIAAAIDSAVANGTPR